MYTGNHRCECIHHRVEWCHPDRSIPHYNSPVNYCRFQRHFHRIAHSVDHMPYKCDHFHKLLLEKVSKKIQSFRKRKFMSFSLATRHRNKTYGTVPYRASLVSNWFLGIDTLWQKRLVHCMHTLCDFHLCNSNSPKCMPPKWLLFSMSMKHPEKVQMPVSFFYKENAFLFIHTARHSLNFALLNRLVHISFAAALISSLQTNSSPWSLLTSLSQLASGTSQASMNVETVYRIRLTIKFEYKMYLFARLILEIKWKEIKLLCEQFHLSMQSHWSATDLKCHKAQPFDWIALPLLQYEPIVRHPNLLSVQLIPNWFYSLDRP